MKKFTSKAIVILCLLVGLGCEKDDSNNATNVDIGGVLIDGVTKKAIPNAIVSLSFNETNSEGSSDTTDADGRFSFKNVPLTGGLVSSTADTSKDSGVGQKGVYGFFIRISDPNYRTHYALYPVSLKFLGATGESGNLASSLVIPLYKTNVNVVGRLVNQTTRLGVSGVVASLYAIGLIDGNNASGLKVEKPILLDTAKTQADGTFFFDKIEQGTKAFILFQSTGSNQSIDIETSQFEIPVNTAETAIELNLGAYSTTSATGAAPFQVTSVTPDDGADLNISASLPSFVFTFSNPVYQTQYTRTDYAMGTGSGTMIDDFVMRETGPKAVAKIGDRYELSASWNATFTQLTIRPIEPLLDGYKYSLDVTAAFAKFEDAFCQKLTSRCLNCNRDLTEVCVVNFSTFISNANPSTPVLVRRDNALFDFNGGTAQFETTVNNTDAPVAYYEVYRKVGGGPNVQIDKISLKEGGIFGDVRFNASSGSFVSGTDLIIDKADSVMISIRAVSKNLRQSAFSNAIVLKDRVAPGIASATYTSADSTVTVVFNEAMSLSEFTVAANYSLIINVTTPPTAPTVTSAIGSFTAAGLRTARLQLSRRLPSPITPAQTTLLVETKLKDLSGNGFPAAANLRSRTLTGN